MASGSVGVHARLTTATVISASVSSTPSVKVTCRQGRRLLMAEARIERTVRQVHQEVDRDDAGRDEERDALHHRQDRKSTRLNSSHSQISYAVFCLKKKNHTQ